MRPLHHRREFGGLSCRHQKAARIGGHGHRRRHSVPDADKAQELGTSHVFVAGIRIWSAAKILPHDGRRTGIPNGIATFMAGVYDIGHDVV